MSFNEPLDYQIGHSQFFDLKIDLSKKPLIPRVETEYWTDLAIKEIKSQIASGNLTTVKILDIFAGSGCVGLAVLKKVPEAFVDFAEVEPKFLEQIKINAALNNIPLDRYKLIQSDIFSNIPTTNKYDFILANPPYIPEGRKEELDKSVTDYEPHGALFSGPDGLDHCKLFLTTVKKSLQVGGQLWMEFDSGQKEAIEQLVRSKTSNIFKSHAFHRDQYDRWRFVVITA